jgi:DNA polymerase-3 subunit alpha
VADFVRFAAVNSIPIGSGRGSSAGSLICYMLGITKIDPLHYGLLFERFINVERNEPPDIDVDVSQARRGEIIEYIKNEYGTDRVSQIIAFGSMKAKLVIKDVCRVLQLPFGLGDAISKILPDPFEGNIETVFNNTNVALYLQRHLDPHIIKKLYETCQKIEGKLRHSSTHAAGVVISNTPLIDNIPMCIKNDNTLTQYDMYSVEKLGLLKFDILGLRTLDVIHEACTYINIRPEDIPLDDYWTYSQIREGETFGVFQYEGWGYTKFIKRMKPQNFEHLIALGALYRPGPMQSGMAEEYVKAMHDGYSAHLDGITDDTYGIYLYQEQVMQAVVKYAGFSMNEADTLRKAIGKKDAVLMETVMNKLIIKLRQNKHSNNFIADLVNKINKFARYGWNKAHAVGYALLSYQTAYLKFNHATPFFCALLNSEIDDNDRVKAIIVEALKYKVNIQNPNINISDTKFKLHNNTIFSGLSSIKGIGTKTCEAIISERDAHGNFKDILDCRNRIPPKKLNSAAMKVLIEGGCF